ncbi:MAG TPA: xanthine dehydrogenase family protein subunit M [Acidimicrobiia bacterium]|nr:xanthine dehydrogenase family protein subunit M [Acidimicrobiia bacterium]
MKPAPFEYHAPTTIAEAVDLLARHGDEAKPLAGGQSLVPMLALRLARFEHLVDLNRVDELRGVARTNGTLRVGAMTTQATVEHDGDVARDVPLLAMATPLIGHFQIRNRGTVGGSLAHADPASEYPAVALALDARFDVASSSGTREVPAQEFFEGTWQTALGADDLLVAVRFPVWEGRCGFACDEVARRHGDFALAGAIAAVELDGSSNVTRAGIALFGMGPAPVRATDAEQALVGTHPASDDDLRELGALAVRDTAPVDDVHASASYRRRVGEYLARKTLRDAIRRAEEDIP